MVIYKFTNLLNKKSYIGQTIQNPNQRRLEHLAATKSIKNHKFYNALRKYGEDLFSFEIIAYGITLEHLNRLEEYFILEYDSIANGYNHRQGGSNRLHSKDSIEKMREAQRRAHARRREEGRDTFIKTKKTSGWKHSEESKAKRKEWSSVSNSQFKGKTWKMIDGKRTWIDKENGHQLFL
jgi:group I intron endonuclease